MRKRCILCCYVPVVYTLIIFDQRRCDALLCTFCFCIINPRRACAMKVTVCVVIIWRSVVVRCLSTENRAFTPLHYRSASLFPPALLRILSPTSDPCSVQASRFYVVDIEELTWNGISPSLPRVISNISSLPIVTLKSFRTTLLNEAIKRSLR